jgi:FAD-dependent urate hydroxylase
VPGLRVVIVGGGLGGLAAAIALRQAGHSVVVYEQAREFRPVGAGISLWPNGVKVLSAMGLGDRVAEMGGHMERMGYADWTGSTLTDFSLAPLYRSVGERAWPLARADLQELLVDTIGSDWVRTGARCVSVTSTDDSASALFADGSIVDGDLVVAADGTHSALRSWVAGPVERAYVGYVNFNALTAADQSIAAPNLWQTWVGGGKRASVMPIGGERLYAFFDVPLPHGDALADDREVIDQLRGFFGDWATPVRLLVDSLDAVRINRVLIHDLPTVGRWFRNRVVLLGDAVHTMAPDLGQGGCQALEDAVVLARCLALASGPIESALARYEQERRPRTAEIVRRARQRAAVIHGEDPLATAAWYESLGRDPSREILAGLEQSARTGPWS